MDITALKKSVNSLFTVTHQYQVPVFQRPYAWTSKELGDFWADIVDAPADGHFLGPVVLYKTDREDDESEREVIDGQQRLATLQMLLALIRDKWTELNESHRAATPNGLLVRNGFFEDEDDSFVFRTGAANWEFFRDFILRPIDDPKRKAVNTAGLGTLSAETLAKNKTLLAGYRNLRAKLKDHIAAGPDDPHRRLEQLVKKLSSKVEVVTIEVTDLEDAFLLFETLNDRGLELSAADLLKSHLLGKLSGLYDGDVRRLTLASAKWDSMLEALPEKPGVTPFLRHYLLLTHLKVQVRQVFPLFKDNVRTSGPETTLDELATMAKSYSRIVNPPSDDSAVTDLLDVKSIGVDTNRVPLLAAARWLDDATFRRFIRLVEILTFRWVVTNKNAQEMETAFRNLAATIHLSHGADVEEAIASLIANLPGNKDFRDGFRVRRMGDSDVASYMLRKIENAVAAQSELGIKPRMEVHIEHVMPQTSTDFWSARVTRDEVYDQVIQRWGNLTLLKSELNESIQNADFSVKKSNDKDMDYTRSRIQITRDLLAFDDWTSREIDLRQQWMGLVACEIWSVKGADRAKLDFPTLDGVKTDPTSHGVETTPPLDDLLEADLNE